MPQVQPKETSGSQSRNAEVGHFYKGFSEDHSRRVNVQSIHKRRQNLIGSVVTLWGQDQEKGGKPFSAFQTSVIELHNKGKLGSDPENAKRLLGFLTVFGGENYSSAEIKTLSRGTFENQDQVNDLLMRAHAGDKKLRAGYGKLSLKSETDESELASLTRKDLAKDQLTFRAALIPHSQYSWGGLRRRLITHLATEHRLPGIGKDLEKFVEEYESKTINLTGGAERIAKYDPTDAKQFLSFIEQGTSSNLESILEGQSEKISQPDKIQTAKDKGYEAISKACQTDNLGRLLKDAAQRHEEVATDFTDFDSVLKWFHPYLTSAEAHKFELVLGTALNDPELYHLLINRLHLNPGDSPTKVLETISSMDQAALDIIATHLEVDTVTRLKEGPWFLKIDAAQSMLNRRLEQISSEATPLPKIEFDKLNLESATIEQAAVLIASGYTETQLNDKNLPLDIFNQAKSAYFKTNEDGDFKPDATGKPEFKDSKSDTDYQTEIGALSNPTNQNKQDARQEIHRSIDEGNEDVTNTYRRLAKQRQKKVYQEKLIELQNPPHSWTSQKANTEALKFARSEYLNMWDEDTDEPDNTYKEYRSLMNSAINIVKKSDTSKKQIAKKSQELADLASSDYKRQNIKQTDLEKLSTIQLATLHIKDAISKDADLTPGAKTEVEKIIDSTGASDVIDEDDLKQYVIDNVSHIRGMDLTFLFSIFDGLSQAAAEELSSDERQKYQNMIS